MRNLLRDMWMKICSLTKFSLPTRTILRDKAIAVAGRVTMRKDAESSYASCPVCLDVIRAPLDADVRMTLAVHLSLWHPDDVKLQWDIMHNKKQSIIHMPSLVLGIGLAVGIGALLLLSPKRQARVLVFKRKR